MKGNAPKFLANRIPVAGGEELESEGMPGKPGPRDEFVNDENQYAQNGHPAGCHRKLENSIRNFAARGSQKGVLPAHRGGCNSSSLQRVAVQAYQAVVKLGWPFVLTVAETLLQRC